MKAMLIGLVALALALLALLLWMSAGLQVPRSPAVEMLEPDTAPPMPTDTSTVVVMTYNIGWAYGMGSEGSGAKKSVAEIQRGLDRIADVIRRVNPHVVLLQEVDFDADRSGGIDQARALATRAGFRWIARAVSWDVNYLPFPYWPPSEHWGRMRSGGAILSRFPLENCHVELLEKPKSQSFVYRAFYLFRYLMKCDARVDGRVLALYNAHFEAFDLPNRAQHARRVSEVLSKEITPLTIFGGDLNTVPPESHVKGTYPDEPETDHSRDTTLSLIQSIAGLRDSVTKEAFERDQESYLTFPADAPNRKLDYLFHGESLEPIDAWVVREAGNASDHLPLVTRLRLPNEN